MGARRRRQSGGPATEPSTASASNRRECNETLLFKSSYLSSQAVVLGQPWYLSRLCRPASSVDGGGDRDSTKKRRVTEQTTMLRECI